MTEPASFAFRKYEHEGAYHHALMDRDPFYAAKIHRALSLIGPGRTVVDVGCGDGVFVKYARERGARVVGVDPREDGVRLARCVTGATKLCVGSADALPLASGSTDVVVMIDVVNYLPQCESAIREVARTLRPAGILVIMSPCDVSLEDERRTTADSWQSHVWTADELSAIVGKYLRISEVAFIEKVIPAPIIDGLFRLLASAGVAPLARRLVGASRRGRTPGGGSASTAAASSGDIVLNTLSLPAMLVRGRERLEYVLIARRDALVESV